jgi:hypothetical protein
MQDLSLAKIEAVRVAIEAASTVQEIKGTLDAATAMKVYADQQRVGKEIELKMAEYIVRAERKLGEIIRCAKEAGQMRKADDGLSRKKEGVPSENTFFVTLEEAGVTRKLSSRAQKIEAIPSADFEQKVIELKESGKLTANAVARPRQVNGKKSDRAPKPHPRHDEVVALHDDGSTYAEIAAKTGIGARQVRHSVEREKIVREVEPTITPDMLSMTAQRKLELAIKQHKEKLTAEWRVAVSVRVDELLANTIGPKLKKEQDEARWVMKSRKGIINRKEYGKILACLHPDRVDPELKERYADAFRLFTKIEKLLLNENENPTQFIDIPKTSAEWEERKRQVSAARKAKRAAHSGIAKT